MGGGAKGVGGDVGGLAGGEGFLKWRGEFAKVENRVTSRVPELGFFSHLLGS